LHVIYWQVGDPSVSLRRESESFLSLYILPHPQTVDNSSNFNSSNDKHLPIQKAPPKTMTLRASPPQPTEVAEVTQTGLTVKTVKGSKIEVEQEVVLKNTSIIDQIGVCAFGLVDAEVAVSQSAGGSGKVGGLSKTSG
jgi:hypothetical protein